MTNDDEDDAIDDEEIWIGICNVVAKRAGISAERAKLILEDAGYHAYGHTGIVEALEVVMSVVDKRDIEVQARRPDL